MADQINKINTWDQLDDENNKEYKQFLYYLNAGKDRDILSAYNSPLPIKKQQRFTPKKFMEMTEKHSWWERVRDHEINIRKQEEDKFNTEKRNIQNERRELNKELHQLARKIAKQLIDTDEEINLSNYLKFVTATTKLHNDIRIEYGEENMFSVGAHKTEISSTATINISTGAKEQLEKLILDEQIALTEMPTAIQK